MSGKPAAATRASTRVKAQPTVPVTRTTRAQAALKSATPPVEQPLPPAKKAIVRKPLVSKDNSAEILAPSAKPKTKAISKATKHNDVPDSDREPIMVSYPPNHYVQF